MVGGVNVHLDGEAAGFGDRVIVSGGGIGAGGAEGGGEGWGVDTIDDVVIGDHAGGIAGDGGGEGQAAGAGSAPGGRGARAGGLDREGGFGDDLHPEGGIRVDADAETGAGAGLEHPVAAEGCLVLRGDK